MRLGLTLMFLASTTASVHADTKKARALNAKGMALYKKKQYEDAHDLFAKAVAEDPELVVARYNLASMSAIQGDTEAVLAELAWLTASKNPLAAKKLAKARTDKDFAPVSTDPQVRVALGLPAFDTLSIADRLLEYGGVWSGLNVAGDTGYEFRFARNGTWRGISSNRDDGSRFKSKGKWSIQGGIVRLRGDEDWNLTFGRCGSFWGDPADDGSFCLGDNEEQVQLDRGQGQLDRGPY